MSAGAARQQLYELWERQQWQAHAIELDRDIEDWAAFPDDERADVLWGLWSFFSIGGGMDAQLQEVRAELNEFAFNALSRRLKVIGVGLPG